MHLLNWISVLLFALVVSAVDPPTELQIDVTDKPANCPFKAQQGDKIKVHYVSIHTKVALWFLYSSYTLIDR